MAHFRGTVTGRRGEASRLGDGSTGLTTRASSWDHEIRVELFTRKDGTDMARVEAASLNGAGRRVLYDGPLSMITVKEDLK